MIDANFYREEELLPLLQQRGVLKSPAPHWWLELPEKPEHRTFSLWQRLRGQIMDRDGTKLGIFARLTYEWFWTDDPYFVRVDMELKEKGL